MPKSQDYTITWTIEVHAHTPNEAANIARLIQLDPNSTATSFTLVEEWDGREHTIDVPLENAKSSPDSGISPKDDLVEKVQELLRNILKDVPQMVDNLVQCGVVGDHEANQLNYRVPKKIMEAVLRDQQNNFIPVTNADTRKDINNYLHFI